MPIKGYKELEFDDRDVVDAHLRADPPLTSELTFTNLFMWRRCYRTLWREEAGCLLLVMSPEGEEPFGLPPVGAGDKLAAATALCADLAEAGQAPALKRVGGDLARALADSGDFAVELDRDNSDYVYLQEELANLPGRRFHKKKNHFNKFVKSFPYEYRALEPGLVGQVLDMQEAWCALRECHLHQSLASEDRAVYEALDHFGRLDYVGGVILIEGKVEAFSLGEALNADTAVIHIEKGNPEFNGIYAAINRLFAQNAWAEMTYLNREQDLGVAGLRKAKESYQPDHMVDKYLVIPQFV